MSQIRGVFALGAVGLVTLAWTTAGPAAQAGATAPDPLGKQAKASIGYSVGPIRDVSVGCPGTGDVSEAVDPGLDYVYQEFEGCDHGNGIGFARSIDGGLSYTPPVALPRSPGGWDPWLAVAPNGTLYAAFMNTIGDRTYPVVDVSYDDGRTFEVEQSLKPERSHNWGDADYIAVSSNGTLYVAWDYGPSNSKVKSRCSPAGSCWATHGDLNVVVQSSTDGAKTFTPMSVVNPGYPDAGADEGEVIVAPDGAIDVLYQGYRVVNSRTLRLADGHEYFSTSTGGGEKWSTPVVVGASAGQITINEWWNDGSIATDSAGDLYGTWDTQGKAGGHDTDTGWVSYSTDGGRTWSAPVQATPDRKPVPHITEVVGAGYGEAYVGWLSSSDPRGYALYLRTLSISAGGAGRWPSKAVRISQQFGDPKKFPGDTFGIVTFSPTSLVLSWGSAVNGSRNSSVFTGPVKVLTGATVERPHRLIEVATASRKRTGAGRCDQAPSARGGPRVSSHRQSPHRPNHGLPRSC